jgi:diadenosine tetraphosphate (Ap4A) HIT family hydrolase
MPGPWTDILIDSKDFTVYKDGYPVTEGHLLFVPKVEDWHHMVKCWEAAYKWGYDWVERGYCDAFNVGQNVGEAAGQMDPQSSLAEAENLFQSQAAQPRLTSSLATRR